MGSIEVKFNTDHRSGKSAFMVIEEYHPLEPGQWEAGWTCLIEGAPGYYDPIEYFISTDGTVYVQPENEVVGIAPAIKATADNMERELSVAFGQEN